MAGAHPFKNDGNPATREFPAPGKIATSPTAGTWWVRHEALVLTVAAVVAVLVLTIVWWRVAGSKPAVEDALLTDARGRPADLAALPADLRDAVTRTLRDGRVPGAPPSPAELHPRDSAPAGPAPGVTFYVVEPVGVLVPRRQPLLRWTTRTDATSYVVHLEPLARDPRTAPPLPPAELPATQTEWTPPVPLTPGTTYAWQVEARRGTATLDRTPATGARFQVLDAARAAELERVEERFSGFPLVMAVALVRIGLVDEAAGQLGKLAREHPQSIAAQRLQRGAEAVRDRNRSGFGSER